MHAEVRGRNRNWKVWVPDPGSRAMPVPLLDQDGNLKEYLMCGAPPDGEGPKYVECYGGPFSSQDEAVEYAHYLGYSDVRIAKTKTPQEALALARAKRR